MAEFWSSESQALRNVKTEQASYIPVVVQAHYPVLGLVSSGLNCANGTHTRKARPLAAHINYYWLRRWQSLKVSSPNSLNYLLSRRIIIIIIIILLLQGLWLDCSRLWHMEGREIITWVSEQEVVALQSCIVLSIVVCVCDRKLYDLSVLLCVFYIPWLIDILAHLPF